jgi:hypothetical protein
LLLAAILDDLVILETLVIQVMKEGVVWSRRSLFVILARDIVRQRFSRFDSMNIKIGGIFHAAHRLGFESLPVCCQLFDAFTVGLLGL